MIELTLKGGAYDSHLVKIPGQPGRGVQPYKTICIPVPRADGVWIHIASYDATTGDWIETTEWDDTDSYP